MGQLLVVTNGYERLPFSLNVNHICINTFANPDARTCALWSGFLSVGLPTVPIYTAISRSGTPRERP